MTTASLRSSAGIASTRHAPARRWHRALGCALLALAQALSAPALAQPVPPSPNTLPALGDTASESLPVGTERKVGDQIMREIRRDPDYLDDPLLLEYLQALWQPLMSAARARGEISPELDERYAWEAFLVRDRSVNAFALPGGYIGVHLGLMAVTATHDELASVLAHELAHVSQRHIARSIAHGKRASLVGIAALILGALAASRSNRADAGSAIMQGGQAAAIQAQLNFSRDMEREADRVGFGVMTQAGYAPQGMAAMFEKLEHAARLNDSGNFPYLRSHPLTVDRIGEARARLGPVPAAAAPPAQVEHALARARARVLMETRTEALQRWQGAETGTVAAIEGPAGRLAAAYSSALASTLLRDWARADAALAQAQALARGGPRGETRALRAVALLQAQSLVARGDVAGARAALAPVTGDGSRPLLLMQAQIAVAAASQPAASAGQTAPASVSDALRRSADELQTWVTSHPADALAWRTLGQVFERLGQRLRALRADAEAQLALGDLAGAAERLRAAQAAARTGGAVDFIEASVIDTRLRDVEAQRRAIAAEQRARGMPG